MKIYYFANKPIGEKCLEILLEFQNKKKLTISLVVSPETTIQENWWGNTSIKEIAKRNNLKYVNPDEARKLSLPSHENSDSWLLSVQYPDIFNEGTLNLFDERTANLHLAPLPDFRGWYGPSHAILQERKSYGWTIHKMTSQVDCGAILASGEVKVAKRETAISLYQKTEESAILGFEKFITQLVNYNLNPKPMKMKKSKFYGRDSLDRFRTINLDQSNPKQTDKIVRALYFPPHAMPTFSSLKTQKEVDSEGSN